LHVDKYRFLPCDTYTTGGLQDEIDGRKHGDRF